VNRVAFYRTSIGKKFIVAITGLILIGFIVGHLLGNLQIFLGPDWVNSYAEHLRALGRGEDAARPGVVGIAREHDDPGQHAGAIGGDARRLGAALRANGTAT
jgi:uncharacterized membrane protein SpoIIM required for sporulation